MMEVTVRLFATLRQQAGWSTKQITVADGATVDDVLQQLEELPASTLGHAHALYCDQPGLCQAGERAAGRGWWRFSRRCRVGREDVMREDVGREDVMREDVGREDVMRET
ncbi:MAG: MoaD/ThiS family protein [Caldilineaceae bacterium]